MGNKRFTSLEEVKTAVAAGESVFWGNESYAVRRDAAGQFVIVCSVNKRTAVLTSDYAAPKQVADFFAVAS